MMRSICCATFSPGRDPSARMCDGYSPGWDALPAFNGVTGNVAFDMRGDVPTRRCTSAWCGTATVRLAESAMRVLRSLRSRVVGADGRAPARWCLPRVVRRQLHRRPGPVSGQGAVAPAGKHRPQQRPDRLAQLRGAGGRAVSGRCPPAIRGKRFLEDGDSAYVYQRRYRTWARSPPPTATSSTRSPPTRPSSRSPMPGHMRSQTWAGRDEARAWRIARRPGRYAPGRRARSGAGADQPVDGPGH